MLYEPLHNFQSGQLIDSEEIDAEFSAISEVLGGNIEAENIKNGSITTSKLDASIDPTTRTAETVGDMVATGLNPDTIYGLTGSWTTLTETITSGAVYMDGQRYEIAGQPFTFDANTTRYLIAHPDGVIKNESSLSVNYNNVPLYKVVTDGSKITQMSPLALGLTGTVMPFVGQEAPTGYLLCDGSEVTRASYRRLFNICQNKFGTPSSAAVFKLPDMRTRMPAGLDTRDTWFNAIGNAGGHKNLQSHGHTVNDPSHSHGISENYTAGGSGASNWSSGSPVKNKAWRTTEGAGTGIWLSNTGAGNGENMPPFLVMNYIIKA